ncbi:MAG: 23S rRNA (adenine(2503)-C(2))-methyltransferase RlmN [Planctomycetes bacterium]|nr:23S rRNA (adenine(2503)-C(2))-methyltransferase RlmN [Planctomycetota bacterium]
MSAEPIDILGLTSDELAERARAELPSGHGIAHRLYPRVMREGLFAPAGFPISGESSQAWSSRFSAGFLRVVRVHEEPGAPGTTAKAILATHDGYEIECVRIPMRHADDGTDQTYTLCLSSQVGCRMGCTFCETGRMGLLRHLTAAEIVSQVVTARATLGWPARNLVFMGMGEALDNAENVIQALRVLTDRRGLGYSHERITICTSGHAEGIAKIAALGWKRLNLSISLNASNDVDRSRIMPVNRKTPLAELQRVLAQYPQRRNFTLGVNYCLLPGINDRREDARGIADFCRPLGRSLVNLIPYNPGTAPLTHAPSEDEVDRFIAWLREDGLPVRRRITKGRSIMAACGQLGNAALRRQRAPVPPAAQ